MKTTGYLFRVLGSTLLILLVQGISFAGVEDEEKVTVYSLQQEGWEDHRERHSRGITPWAATVSILASGDLTNNLLVAA